MSLTFKTKQIFCLVYCCALFMSGVFVICMTTVVSYKMFVHSRFVPNENLGPLVILLILGFLHLFLTWLGVKGPTREHVFYVVVLIISSIVIAVIVLIAVIWTIVLWIHTNGEVETIMTKSFSGLLQDGRDIQDWTLLERRYNCCGIFGPADYAAANCTKSDIGCKEPYVRDMHNLHLQLSALGVFIFLESVIGCFLYFAFKKALYEERARRAREKRERMLRARARRLSQPR